MRAATKLASSGIEIELFLSLDELSEFSMMVDEYVHSKGNFIAPQSAYIAKQLDKVWREAGKIGTLTFVDLEDV